MPKNAKPNHLQAQMKAFNEALDNGALAEVRHMLQGMPFADTAHLLESSPPRERNILWKLISKEDEGDVLQYLHEEIAAQFLRHRNAQEIIDTVEDFEPDDFADLLQELPRTVARRVLESMNEQQRQRVETVLSFPEDTAGGLMNTDTITVRPNISLNILFRYLRRHKSIPDMTDNILVVNRADKFVGILPLTKLLVSDPHMSVREAMQTDVLAIHANMPDNEVAAIFERQDLVSAPVVNDEGRLLGRITIDDVVDVIREDADHSLMSMAGLDEDEDTFAPVFKTARRRSVWLGINLLTAFFASAVIGLFQETIDKVVALAVLMPIVASMGGIAGNQTLTLVIRGMALGQVGASNARWLLSRETIVGFINGSIWSVVVGGVASYWFNDTSLGLIIASAMVINLILAGVAGASLPMILQRLNIDPALSGGVILTTLTDVIGFFAFLGLATLYYL
ncbi:magnesium transporter [Gammaproteobacteria bacterium 42_54_T18]|nr:magnesium transporter [Gammaproteobacteria bacterium 42_54_T18]